MALVNPTVLSTTTHELIVSQVIDAFYEGSVLGSVLIDKSDIARNNQVNQINIPYVDTISPVHATTQDLDGDDISTTNIALGAATIPLTDHKAFRVEVDPKWKAQSQVETGIVVANAIAAVWSDYTEKVLAAELTGQGSGSKESIATPHKLTEAHIIKARTQIRKSKLPQMEFKDRFFAVDPSQYGVLLSIDNFIRADKTGYNETLVTGELGKIHGFRFLETTALTGSADNTSKAVAFQRQAVQFATQLTEFGTVMSSTKLIEYIYFKVLWGKGKVQLDKRSYGYNTLV